MCKFVARATLPIGALIHHSVRDQILCLIPLRAHVIAADATVQRTLLVQRNEVKQAGA
jgi:hypothetical protein